MIPYPDLCELAARRAADTRRWAGGDAPAEPAWPMCACREAVCWPRGADCCALCRVARNAMNQFFNSAPSAQES